MALRYEHATQGRDRFIAHALEALSQSVPDPPEPPTVPADYRGIADVRARKRRRRLIVEEEASSETTSDQVVSTDRVRPSGFEPETCGLRDRCRGVQGVLTVH